MTVTETAAKANTPGQSAEVHPWTRAIQDDHRDCWYHRTYLQNGLIQQQAVPCKSLDCHYCGNRKRHADLKRAERTFRGEPAVYVIIVPSWKVDHLRKQAARRDHPLKSVPIGPETNAVFSTYQFEAWTHDGTRHAGAERARSEDVRRIFLTLRVSKRQLTTTGRWAIESKGAGKRRSDCITLSKAFVGPEAFRNVAKVLRQKVGKHRDTIFFPADDEKDAEFYKKLLVAEEYRVRERNRNARGFKMWGGHLIRIPVAA